MTKKWTNRSYTHKTTHGIGDDSKTLYTRTGNTKPTHPQPPTHSKHPKHTTSQANSLRRQATPDYFDHTHTPPSTPSNVGSPCARRDSSTHWHTATATPPQTTPRHQAVKRRRAYNVHSAGHHTRGRRWRGASAALSPCHGTTACWTPASLPRHAPSCSAIETSLPGT